MVSIANAPVQVGDSFSTRYEGQATPTATDFIFPSVQDSIIVTNYGFTYITAISSGESVRVQPNGGIYRFKGDSDTVNIQTSQGKTNPITIEGRSIAASGSTGVDTTARANIQTITTQLTDIAYSVKSFGAKGDYNPATQTWTDDTVSINNAISYVSSIGGGIVTVPYGTYMINADIGVNLKSNVKLKFYGGKLKTIPNVNSKFNTLNIIDCSNVELSFPVIEGDRDTHLGTVGEWGMGINIKGDVKNIKIDNPRISNCWGDGMIIQRGRINGIDYIPKDITISGIAQIENCRRQGISILAVNGLKIQHLECIDINEKLPMAGVDIEPEFAAFDTIADVRIDYLKTLRCHKGFTMRTSSVLAGNVSIGTIEHIDGIQRPSTDVSTTPVHGSAFRVFFEAFNASQADKNVSVDNILSTYGDAFGVENAYIGVTPKVNIGNVFVNKVVSNSISAPEDKAPISIHWTMDTDLSTVLGGVTVRKIVIDKFENADAVSNTVRPFYFYYGGTKDKKTISIKNIEIGSYRINTIGQYLTMTYPISNLFMTNCTINTFRNKTSFYRQDTNLNLLVEDNNIVNYSYATNSATNKIITLRVYNSLTKFELNTKGATTVNLDTAYGSSLFDTVMLNGASVTGNAGVFSLGSYTDPTKVLITADKNVITVNTI